MRIGCAQARHAAKPNRRATCRLARAAYSLILQVFWPIGHAVFRIDHDRRDLRIAIAGLVEPCPNCDPSLNSLVSSFLMTPEMVTSYTLPRRLLVQKTAQSKGANRFKRLTTSAPNAAGRARGEIHAPTETNRPKRACLRFHAFATAHKPHLCRGVPRPVGLVGHLAT